MIAPDVPENDNDTTERDAILFDVITANERIATATEDLRYCLVNIRNDSLIAGIRGYTDRVRNMLQSIEANAAALEDL